MSTRGLLDTSVVIDWEDGEVRAQTPDEAAVSAVTLAELAAGPHLTDDPLERARRQARVQQVEVLFDPLPVDASVARSYGQLVAVVVASGRHRRRRVADLLIAAVAHANQIPLYTRNPDDFSGLADLLTVIAV